MAVDAIYWHQSYDYQTLDHDIMLMKLAHPVTVNEFVQPISLPTACPSAGDMCVVSGWGNIYTDSGPCQGAEEWWQGRPFPKHLSWRFSFISVLGKVTIIKMCPFLHTFFESKRQYYTRTPSLSSSRRPEELNGSGQL